MRAWEILGEVVKAANSAEGFTGEDSRVSSRLQTKFMVVMNQANAPDFDLLAIFQTSCTRRSSSRRPTRENIHGRSSSGSGYARHCG